MAAAGLKFSKFLLLGYIAAVTSTRQDIGLTDCMIDRLSTQDPAQDTLFAHRTSYNTIAWGYLHDHGLPGVHPALGTSHSHMILQGGLVFGYRDGLHVFHLNQPDKGWTMILPISRVHCRSQVQSFSVGAPDAEGVVPVYLFGQDCWTSWYHKLRKFLYNPATLTSTEVEGFAPNVKVAIRLGAYMPMSVDEVSGTLTVAPKHGPLKPMVFDLDTGAAREQGEPLTDSEIDIKTVKIVGNHMAVIDSADRVHRLRLVDGVWTMVPGLEHLLLSESDVLMMDLKYDGELVFAAYQTRGVYFVTYKMP